MCLYKMGLKCIVFYVQDCIFVDTTTVFLCYVCSTIELSTAIV
uniref:Uncharacterized protein n=1 Tax=Anguilla anguilla TaxID=7936 RepID=A0A0E9PHA7_ANGAN